MADPSLLTRNGARVAEFPTGKTPRAARTKTAFLQLRPMAGVQPMGGSQNLRDQQKGLSYGRHSFRRKSFQRRRLGKPRLVRPRLERRSAARESFQSGPVHRKMGSKLGRPELPLGRTSP